MTKLLLLGLGLPLPTLFIAAVVSEERLPGLGALVIPFIVIILLVAFNGLFVAAEFALIGVRPTQMEHMANEGNRIAEYFLSLLRSQDKQKQYLATAQLGITLASLALGMYGEPQISRFVEPYLARLLNFDPHDTLIVTVGYLSALGLLTYLHIAVGEMVPKSLALAAPDRAALSIAGFMRLMQAIFAWPVRFLNSIGMAILSIFRIPPAEGHARLHSPEELEIIVSESAKGGILNEAEEEMISNILNFADRQVLQVMTPRRKIEAVAHDTPLPELLQLVTESKYSRFPVYEENLDHIIGVLHLKDLVYQQLRQKGKFDIRLLLRPGLVVPEHYPVENLLTAFKRRRLHMAIVLDEYGGTDGIVTLEDLVEEIVGEVRDEFDMENEPIVEQAPGVLEVAGDYLLDDLQDLVHLGNEEDLPDVETVGGLVMTQLGRLPQVGDTVTYRDDIHFTVLAVDGRALARARIEYSAAEQTEEDQDI